MDDGIAYDPKRNVFYTSSSLDTPKIHRWIVGDNGKDWQYDREMLLYGSGTIYACPGGIATDSEYLFCLAAGGKIHRYLFTNTNMLEQRGLIDLGTETASMGIEWINGVLYIGGTGESSTRLTAINTSNWPAGMVGQWSGYEPIAQVTTTDAGSIRTLVADGRNLNVLSSSGTAAYQYPLFMDSFIEAHAYSDVTGTSSRPYQIGGHIDMFDGTGSLDTTRWQVPFGVWNRSNGVMLQSATGAFHLRAVFKDQSRYQYRRKLRRRSGCFGFAGRFLVGYRIPAQWKLRFPEIQKFRRRPLPKICRWPELPPSTPSSPTVGSVEPTPIITNPIRGTISVSSSIATTRWDTWTTYSWRVGS